MKSSPKSSPRALCCEQAMGGYETKSSSVTNYMLSLKLQVLSLKLQVLSPLLLIGIIFLGTDARCILCWSSCRRNPELHVTNCPLGLPAGSVYSRQWLCWKHIFSEFTGMNVIGLCELLSAVASSCCYFLQTHQDSAFCFVSCQTNSACHRTQMLPFPQLRIIKQLWNCFINKRWGF